MSLDRSLGQMIAELEKKVGLHRERQSFHAEQEALHRDKAAQHGAELEAAQAHLQALRAAAETAGELLGRDEAAPSSQPERNDTLDVNRKRALSRMVAQVVESKSPDETFGARAVTQAVQERWGAQLRHHPDSRSVAALLRRWALSGRLHQVREGRAHHEALFQKKRPGGAG